MSVSKVSAKIVRYVVYTILVALLWDVTYILNMFVFSSFRQSQFITWIFIPAGVRLVAVLLLDGVAIPGLFLGAMITNYLMNDVILPTAIIISLISATTPYIAIAISKYILKIDDMLSNLDLKEVLSLSLIMSIVTAFSHNTYFYSKHMYNKILLDVFGMFIGDFFGCLIMLYAFSLALKWIRHSVKKSNTQQ